MPNQQNIKTRGPSKSVRVWDGRKRGSNRSPLHDYDDDDEEEQKFIYFDFSIRFVTINDLSFFF